MRYHYKHPEEYKVTKGVTYTCNHAVYMTCTLYLKGEKGLAIIQQRFNPIQKTTYWSEIDPWLVDELYFTSGFKEYFNRYADAPTKGGLYPSVPVRKVMWALRMKPIKKEPWETTFDRCPI